MKMIIDIVVETIVKIVVACNQSELNENQRYVKEELGLISPLDNQIVCIVTLD